MIVLVDHNASGTLGVIVNQPSVHLVAEALPRWSDIATDPRVVFDGGPVQPSTGLALARGRGNTDDTDALTAIPGLPGAYTLNLEADPAIAAAYVEDLRLFSGYAGWSPRQLESEITSGAWFVADAQLDDLFTDTPHTLWAGVLDRQRGETRWFTNYPSDPRSN